MTRDHLLGYPPVLAALYPDDSPRRSIRTTPKAPMSAADKAARRALDPGSGKVIIPRTVKAPLAPCYRAPFGAIHRINGDGSVSLWLGYDWGISRLRVQAVVAQGTPCADPSL